jgi:hypothetical protein
MILMQTAKEHESRGGHHQRLPTLKGTTDDERIWSSIFHDYHAVPPPAAELTAGA